MLRDSGRKTLGSQGTASSLAAPKPTQTAASLSSQPCTCPSARLSANQGRAWHKEPLSPPLWPQVHGATPGQGETAGTWSGFVLQSPGDGGTALPPPSAATRLFLGAKKKKKKQRGGCRQILRVIILACR